MAPFLRCMMQSRFFLGSFYAKRLMEVQAMKMILQRMILGSEAFKIAARATDRYHVQPAGGVSDPGKQSVPQPDDLLMDLESARLMEERYCIREEGLF